MPGPEDRRPTHPGPPVTIQFADRVLSLGRTGKSVAEIAARRHRSEIEIREAVTVLSVALPGESADAPRRPYATQRAVLHEKIPKRWQDRYGKAQ